MGKGIMISATGTDVGKTYIAAAIGYRLAKEGYKVAYYKPIQSGGEMRGGKLIAPDVAYIEQVCGDDVQVDCYNSYCFREPVSPHLAAEIEGVTVDAAKLLVTYWGLMEQYDYVIVEGAGGLAVPLIRDELWIYELAKLFQSDVVLVADAGVGTLHHTLSSYGFAKEQKINVPLIILNHYIESNIAHRDNRVIIGKEIPEAKLQAIETCHENGTEAIRSHYDRWLGSTTMASLLMREE